MPGCVRTNSPDAPSRVKPVTCPRSRHDHDSARPVHDVGRRHLLAPRAQQQRLGHGVSRLAPPYAEDRAYGDRDVYVGRAVHRVHLHHVELRLAVADRLDALDLLAPDGRDASALPELLHEDVGPGFVQDLDHLAVDVRLAGGAQRAADGRRLHLLMHLPRSEGDRGDDGVEPGQRVVAGPRRLHEPAQRLSGRRGGHGSQLSPSPQPSPVEGEGTPPSL